MVKNNIEVDVKVKCIESEMTQAKLAEKIDTTKIYVNRVIKKQDGVVNKTFVQMGKYRLIIRELIIKRDMMTGNRILLEMRVEIL